MNNSYEAATDNYIETFSGIKFDFLNPKPEQISIVDIAHSLGMQVRYTGHAKRFYSIAEHSMVVSDLCPDECKLWGLMHDATEAYLTDVASPIKAHLSNYYEMEKNLMNAIAEKYDLEPICPPHVKEADREALLAEAKVLMKSKGEGWANMRVHADKPISDVKFDFYDPEQAKSKFIERFLELTS